MADKGRGSDPQAFRFIKYDKVGEAAAEDDDAFLSRCFVETRDLMVALNPAGKKCLIVGHTGSGKSALLMEVRRKFSRTTIVVGPDELAFSYITNSRVIQWLQKNEVRLDPFFKLLWRHVFVVEVLKARYKWRNEKDSLGFFEKFRVRFDDQLQRKERALKYLNDWGSLFWKESDERVKEVLSTLERRVTESSGVSADASILSKGLKLDGKHEAVEGAKEEVRKEVAERAQRIIHDPQMSLLKVVMEDLDEMMDGEPEPYYLIIDRLDDDWVDDSVKFSMIRALIETVREFRHLKRVKVLVALRRDLLDRLFLRMKDPGFQEEKYETFQLGLQWTVNDLTTLLDRRVSTLVSSRYSASTPVQARAVFKEKRSLDYIIERSRLRPRDVIQYMNYCIDRSIEQDKIPHQRVTEAEFDYSTSRLKALRDEWSATFPNLVDLVEVLKRRVYPISAKDLRTDRAVEMRLLEIATGNAPEDEIKQHARAFSEKTDEDQKRSHIFALLLVLHRVGVVALKPDGREEYLWAQEEKHALPLSDLSDTAKIRVHLCYSKTLSATLRTA